MENINEILDYNKINELRNIDSTNDGNFFVELIDLYLSQLAELKKEIQSAFNKKDFIKTSKNAHNLKGASLNLGATALADICRGIEKNIKENHLKVIEEFIAQLEPISKTTIEALEEVQKIETEKIESEMKWIP